MKKSAWHLLLITALCGCAGNDKYSEERTVIGTFVRVDVCRQDLAPEAMTAAFDEVWQRFETIEELMNAYDSASDIGRINHSEGREVFINRDVYDLLEKGIAFSRKTSGRFDITVRPLVDLWQEAEKRGTLPTSQEIREARDRVGVDLLHLTPSSMPHVSCDNCQVDLGGIAKGYAVDEAAAILRRHGAGNFLIDAGGDLYAAGKNCRGKPWRIAIRHPREEDKWADVVHVSDMAVTTSGDYEQFYEIEGQYFSHIIDPKTGYPQRGVVSATVIAPTAIEADAYSTALTVWNPWLGIDFIDGLGQGYAALLILEGDTKKDDVKQVPSAAYKDFQQD